MKEQSNDSPYFKSFVIRIWFESSAEGGRWRASVLRVADGQRFGFASAEAALEFIRQSMCEHKI